MSENLNRSTPDFSKYDSMSIGELEEILRADAQGPERDDSDVDEILYVMEVLAKKRRQNGIAGKTALEAYQEFQQHYLHAIEEVDDIVSVPDRKATIIPFRRIATIAASLVLVFTLATSANAFSFKDMWNAVVNWAQETFSFSMGVEVSEPLSIDTCQYTSFQEILEKNGRNANIVPSWIPNEYSLSDVIIDRNPKQETFLAIYLTSNGEDMLKISVQSYLSGHPEQVETSEHLLEVYSVFGTDYYIFQNNKLIQAAWTIDIYECYIAGELSIEEIKLMIDSIGKG